MRKRLIIMALAAELGLMLTGGIIALVATKGGQTCETAYSNCGMSVFVQLAWDAALLMPICLVATLVAAGGWALYKKNQRRVAIRADSS